jgi:hypothetical protein
MGQRRGKPEGERVLGRSGRSWNDNVKLILKKQSGDAEGINLAQDWEKLRDILKPVMNLRFTRNRQFLDQLRAVSLLRRFCSTESVK